MLRIGPGRQLDHHGASGAVGVDQLAVDAEADQDRAARTVVVKLSSWPEAQNTAYLLDTLRSCAAVAERLDTLTR